MLWDVHELSSAQEVAISVLTSAIGTPLAAVTYWILFREASCPSLLDQSRMIDCVITLSGESYSWDSLARKPEALGFALVLASLIYLILDLLKEGAAASGPRLPT